MKFVWNWLHLQLESKGPPEQIELERERRLVSFSSNVYSLFDLFVSYPHQSIRRKLVYADCQPKFDPVLDIHNISKALRVFYRDEWGLTFDFIHSLKLWSSSARLVRARGVGGEIISQCIYSFGLQPSRKLSKDATSKLTESADLLMVEEISAVWVVVFDSNQINLSKIKRMNSQWS